MFCFYEGVLGRGFVWYFGVYVLYFLAGILEFECLRGLRGSTNFLAYEGMRRFRWLLLGLRRFLRHLGDLAFFRDDGFAL